MTKGMQKKQFLGNRLQSAIIDLFKALAQQNIMAKARFYISDRVQKVGYRLFIIQKILNSTLDGTALNLPDGRIEVRLKGEKEHILRFIEELKKEKPELAQNPIVSQPEFDEGLDVPDAMRSSQALLTRQLGKGVKHIVGIENRLENVGKDIQNLAKETREGFKELGQKIDSLPEKISRETREGFKELGEKVDALPEKIAKAFKEAQ